MLPLNSRRLLVVFGFFALSVSPVVHAAAVQSSAGAGNGVTYNSDRVESREGGATLLLTGHVVVHVPCLYARQLRIGSRDPSSEWR